MRHGKKMISVLILGSVLLGITPVSALAATENTTKEEVVYVNLNADGSVKEINVVNIFHLDERGQIVDYGEYESLRNMTSTDKIGYTDELVTIDAKAGALYYEGKLSSNSIPWNIVIRYYMDGKEYSAKEIAGKSGALKITMEITENTECGGNFFEGYALQASVTLDTKKCSNIHGEGATVANVGSDKQFTYTVLPGKGADVEITADVTDFEMSSIAINGIKLNLEIEIDDAEMQSKLDELNGAVGELDKGASELNDGAKELYDGTTLLDNKVEELHTGVGKLSDGAGGLSGGLSEITAKEKELLDGAYAAFAGLCAASETALNTELTKNGMMPVTLTPENYATVLNEILRTMESDRVYPVVYEKALSTVTSQVEAQAEVLYSQAASQTVLAKLMASGYSEQQAIAYLQTEEGQALIAQTVQALTDEQKMQIKDGYIEQMMKSEEVIDQITMGVSMYDSAAASITELKEQLDNYQLFYDGLRGYTSAVGTAASGADELKHNMSILYSDVGMLKTSVGELNEGVKSLFEGTTELKDSTGEFVVQTSGIDTELNDEIGAMISSASGSNIEVSSFVSEKNTNIESVQFVIQTESIEKEETVNHEPIVEEKLNFWQKVLRLFGLF